MWTPFTNPFNVHFLPPYKLPRWLWGSLTSWSRPLRNYSRSAGQKKFPHLIETDWSWLPLRHPHAGQRNPTRSTPRLEHHFVTLPFHLRPRLVNPLPPGRHSRISYALQLRPFINTGSIIPLSHLELRRAIHRRTIQRRQQGRLGSRLRSYHPVAPRPLRYGPFVHRL
jgi:hypothetical protein